MLTKEQLKQIVESGSLKRSPKYEEKIRELAERFSIKTFKEVIEECKPEWGDSTLVAEQAPSPKNNEQVPEYKKRKPSATMTLDEKLHFDPDAEFERILALEGDKMNGRDKKNLKKRLKRKAKKLKKKFGERYQPGGENSKNLKETTPQKKKPMKDLTTAEKAVFSATPIVQAKEEQE